jgi:hypothetical protein
MILTNFNEFKKALNIMSLISRLFGDPTISTLQGYQKDLLKIKKIQEEYNKTIESLASVKAKTAEFKSRFDSLRLSYITEKDLIDTAKDMDILTKIESHEKNKKNYIQ